jgi:HD-GYP domain-containing protein (c-di-GMP phosphodiesterase class II)
MPQVTINQLKSGEILAEDVMTKMGNLLLQKGSRITQREIEILRAFLIEQVNVEYPQQKQVTSAAKDVAEEAITNIRLEHFYRAYDEMLELHKKVFLSAAPGMNLPVMDLRAKLDRLIGLIDQYNPLTFAPRRYHVDDYLHHSGVLTALTSYLIAVWNDVPKKDHIPISMGALLHDIGNMVIDQAIFKKTGKLTRDEMEEMKKHTVNGYNILKMVTTINEGTKLCALQHHERMDGGGYPLGLKGTGIHLYARIVAISDTFHAMTLNRLHRQKTSPYLVLEELHQETFGRLDPILVNKFIERLTQFNIGTVVRLNTGQIGEIVFTEAAHPTRPWVKIDGEIINLNLNRKLYISEVIKV